MDGETNGSRGEAPRSAFEDHASNIENDLGDLARDIRAATREFREVTSAHLDARPYTTLALGAGLGAILAGGIPMAAARIAASAGARAALAWLAREAMQGARGESV